MTFLTKLLKTFRSSFRNNLRFTFALMGLIPLFVISAIFLAVLSEYQWNALIAETQGKVSSAATHINMELEYYIRTSANIVSNPDIRSGVDHNYGDSLERWLDFYNVLELYLNNNKDPLIKGEREFILLSNNPTLFKSANSRPIDKLPDTHLKEAILQSDATNVFWGSSNQDSIIFYRNMSRLKNYSCVLTVNVPLYKLERYIKDLQTAQTYVSFNGNIYGSKGMDADAKTVMESAKLLNGGEITVHIPITVKIRFMLVNFGIWFAFMAISTLIVLRIVTSLSNRITITLESFINEINTDNPLLQDDIASIDEFDEFVKIKARIKKLVRDISRLHRENFTVSLQKQSLELELLQSKLNPHLLYNSLSSIKWKAMELGDDKFVTLLGDLARFYRYTLAEGQSTVTIEQEIDMIRTYLSIMEMIHGQSYPCDIVIEESLLGTMIIKQLLQPIVENAILHGVNHNSDAKISIKGFTRDEYIIFEISDNGVGMSEEKINEINIGAYKSKYKYYGIRNTARRIELYYPEGGSIRFQSSSGNGTTVILTLKKTVRKI